MKSSFSLGACTLRSVQHTLQGRVHLQGQTFASNGFRQVTTQTRQPKHIAGAATTNAKGGQKWAHASATTSDTRHHPPLIVQDVRAASPVNVEPKVLYPENDLSSTRPARLDPPEGPVKEDDGSIKIQSRGNHLFQLGKAFLGFYKTGLKNVWSNYKEYQELRQRLGGRDVHDLVRDGDTPKISRREFQLYLRTRHDLKTLVPFALVFAVCGELTPLVIPALGTAVVPYTCRIPKQVHKDLQKTVSRIEDIERIGKDGMGSISLGMAYIHGLDPFGLCLRNTPILGALLWRLRTGPKLRQRIDDLVCDAKLIMNEGGADRLDPAELVQFCVEVGKLGAIKRLLDRHAQGAQSHVPLAEVESTRKELQVFLDGVHRMMALPPEDKIATACQPEAIFVGAAEYARSLGVEGPYIPPLSGAPGKADE